MHLLSATNVKKEMLNVNLTLLVINTHILRLNLFLKSFLSLNRCEKQEIFRLIFEYESL